MQGLAEFLKALSTNDAIRAEINAAKGKSDAAVLQNFVDVGARHGYTFSADDVEDMMDAALSDAVQDEELSDEELEAVAGGKGMHGLDDVAEELIEWLISQFDECP